MIPRAIALRAVLLATACCAVHAAQAAEAPAAAAPKSGTVSEVVVEAAKPQPPGAVVGDVKPDLTLQPEDIATYGVTSITDLLDELAPEIRSDAGRGGEGPAILVNGHRISDFREIRNLPTEAILRIDILPEEAALKYGFSSNQRVINFVLKPLYNSRTADASGGAATEGGAAAGAGSVTMTRIRGDNRVNLNVRYNAQAALTEADRSVTPLTAGQPFDLAGNVVPAPGALEVDPALSALAGRPVAIAGAPGVTGRPLALADFLTSANQTNAGRFRTISPETQKLSADATFSRPIGDIRATLNATFEANTSQSLRGLPTVGLLVPAGDPFSPFAGPVQADWQTDAFGPLQQSADSWQGHLGFSLNEQRGSWRLAFTGNYDHVDSRNENDVGLDASALQAALAARSPTVNPFAPPSPQLLALRAQDTSRSKSDTGNIQFVAAGPLFGLPAGKVFTSFRVGANGSRFTSQSERAGLRQSTDFTRSGGNAQGNIDVPVTSRSAKILPRVGDLSLNLHGALQQASDFGTLTSYGFGLNWRPFEGLTLLVSRDYDQAAPSQAQLGNPLLLTPDVRIFDFATGQTVDVTQVTGGNPALRGDERARTKVTLNWRPFAPGAKQQLSIRADYNLMHTKDPILSFPAVTADIEDAFPDRFIRDASGQLTTVDLRPVNFTSQDTSELRYGFDYSIPIGPVTQPARRGPGALIRGPGGPGGPGGPPDGASDGAGPGPGSADGGPPPTIRLAPGGPRPGGFAGRGPGGGGSGRAGGGGRGGVQEGRLRIALFHTVHFVNRQLVRPGGPLLDFLNGASLGQGGQPQHEVEGQINIFERGYGGEVALNWKSGSFVRGGGGPATDLDFSGLATVRVRFFVEMDQRKTLIAKAPWLKSTRLSFSINNLFDQRMRVHDATGTTPLNFQPDYLDPIGRTWRIGLHKVF